MSDPTIPSVVIYGDFNCPFSALASVRADRLEAAGHLHVDWRPVEHDPSIGRDETSLTADQEAGYRQELEQIEGLLADDETPWLRLPSRRLNTHDLIRRYAATPPARRAALRAAIYDAYWVEGRDLTSDKVVEEIVANVEEAVADVGDDAGTEASDADADRIAAEWQREFDGLAKPIVPSMILDDGYVSRGLGALSRLAEESFTR